MPITGYPFKALRSGDVRRAFLPIRIYNPSNGQHLQSWGLIDTGADDCALPASFAMLLGHNLSAGTTKKISTGNGESAAYAHTTRIEILDIKNPSRVVYTIQDTPIDFMPNLPLVLLGVNKFLSHFVLNMDYPRQRFSIKRPRS
jgi:predicted aspartyl protease